MWLGVTLFLRRRTLSRTRISKDSLPLPPGPPGIALPTPPVSPPSNFQRVSALRGRMSPMPLGRTSRMLNEPGESSRAAGF
jgi:hypothetical protein